MTAEQLAEILQTLLTDRMAVWNSQRAGLDQPLHCLTWANLDPLSRALYIERAEQFLRLYTLTPQEVSHGLPHGSD